MTNAKTDITSKATFQGFAAVILWSVTVAFVRSISEQLGAMTGAASLYLVSGSTGLIIQIVRGKFPKSLKKGEARYLLICGTLFVLYMFFFFLAIGKATTRVQVLEAGLLNYLWPVLTLLGSVIFNNKKFKWFLIPSIFIAVAGTFIVLTTNSGNGLEFKISEAPLVYIFSLAGAVSWAAYSILAGKLAGNSDINPVPLFLLVTGVILFALSCGSPESGSWSAGVLVEITILGIATLAGYELWDRAMRKGNVTAVAAFSYLTPLFSTVFSAVYLSVEPSANLFSGCVLLIMGSIMSWKAVK
jgi:drug/metabolite transporter (DMT)-like permease